MPGDVKDDAISSHPTNCGNNDEHASHQGLSTPVRFVAGAGGASVAGTVMENVFDGAELWPVVSSTTTVKLCSPTLRMPVVKVVAGPITVPIGTVGSGAALSKMRTSAISEGERAVGGTSVRKVGSIQVSVTVLMMRLVLLLRKVLRWALVMRAGRGGALRKNRNSQSNRENIRARLLA